jgi:hypothetical protein
MAGTLTVTRDPRQAPNEGRQYERVVIDWVSSSGGAADVSITNLYGFLIKMVTDPAAGGSAPTDNYDITLVDENGIDALAGAGADRDTANTEQVYPTATSASVPVFLCGTHTFTVATAGDTKSGRAVLYIAESL